MKLITNTLILMSSCFFTSTTAFACACCADPGTWGMVTRELSGHDLETISQLAFTGEVRKSIGMMDSELQWQEGEVQGRFRDGALTLKFSQEPENATTTLRFTPGNQAENFVTDRGITGEYGETQLYKEIRLTGSLTSNHPELLPVTGDEALLILQGNGNHCLNPEDINHWILTFKTREGEIVESARAFGPVRVR